MAKRRVSVELELEVARYNASATSATAVTRRVSAAVDELGDEADDTSRDMTGLAANTDIAARRVDDLGDEALATAAELAILDRQLGSVSASARRMAADVTDGDGLDIGDIGDGLAAGARVGAGVSSGLTRSLGRGSLHTKAVMALVALAVVASPAIGAIVAGAVVGTTLTGGIVGGIFAASQHPFVRRAGELFKRDISSSFFASGESFVEPIQNALRSLSEDFDRLNLDESFERAAPAVEILADGIGQMAREIMPGFNEVLDKSIPIAAEMGKGLAYLGQGISDMLSEIIRSEGTLEGLRYIFILLGDGARLLGKTVGALGNTFHFLAHEGAIITGMLEDLLPELGPFGRALGGVFAYLNDQLERLTGTGEEQVVIFERMDGVVDGAAKSTRVFTGLMEELTHDTKDARTELAKFNSQVDELDGQLTGMMDKHFALGEAQDRVAESLARLREQVIEQRKEGVKGAGSLVGQTEAARANRDMVRGITRDYADLIFENQRLGLSTEGLQKAMEDELVAMGFAREEARLYTKELADVKEMMDQLKSKEIKLRVVVEQSRRFGAGNLEFAGGEFRQHGGPVIPGVPYAINEGLHGGRAVEWVTFSQPGMVSPASLTPMGGPITIENHIEVGGEVVRVVRTEISERDRELRRRAGV